MKIVVIHGDDIIASFKRFTHIISSLKKADKKIINLDTKNKKLDISEIIRADNLFQEDNLYVHRNATKLSPTQLKWLSDNSSLAANVLLYLNKPASATLKKSLPKETKFENFDLPKIIFQFMDLLYPGNAQSITAQYKKIIQTHPPEFLLSLIASRLRELYWYKSDPESLNFPSWRLNKIKSQANKFTTDQISLLINSLAEIDIKSKTGKGNLSGLLAFTLIKQLK